MNKNKKVINFYDTNIFLHDLKYIEENGFFLLSSVTLQELENIKTSGRKDEQVRYEARKASRFLLENEDNYEVIVVNKKHHDYLKELGLDEDNDNLIMACAKLLDENIAFYSNDICCYNLGKNMFKLDVHKLDKKINDNYKGYIEITENTKGINDLYQQYNNGYNILDLCENEYVILTNSDLHKSYELKYINGQLVDIKLPPSKVIKGLNSKQRCALDLLNNKEIPIKIIAGNYGSGKTMLSIRMALHHILDKGTYSKIMLVRNPIGAGETIGFLKGTKEDKIKEFYKPIEQNLEGGEYQLQDMIQKGQLETEIPYYMKGMSLQNTFVLVDECEDLNKQLFKLIGSRIGHNSCVAFVGDWKQAETRYVHDNGLSQFIQFAKGNPLVGICVLDEDVRSSASKIFADF